MATAANDPPGSRVVGYEANGGFLLGFGAEIAARPLAHVDDPRQPAATGGRAAPGAAGAGELAALLANEPPRFTATDRLENIQPEGPGACWQP